MEWRLEMFIILMYTVIIMVGTERLHIYPASKEAMVDFKSSQTNDILKTAYQEMLDGCLTHPEEWDYYAIWMNDDRVMITCCNDGIRPVIFKIERIDIDN